MTEGSGMREMPKLAQVSFLATPKVGYDLRSSESVSAPQAESRLKACATPAPYPKAPYRTADK